MKSEAIKEFALEIQLEIAFFTRFFELAEKFAPLAYSAKADEVYKADGNDKAKRRSYHAKRAHQSIQSQDPHDSEKGKKNYSENARDSVV
jgi:hypothetical protein